MFSRFSAWFWVDMLGVGFRIVKWVFFFVLFFALCLPWFSTLLYCVFCFPGSFLFSLYSFMFCSDMRLSRGRQIMAKTKESSSTRFISWNVKGVNNNIKINHIMSHLQHLRGDVFFLQETHLKTSDIQRLKRAWVGHLYHSGKRRCDSYSQKYPF